MTNLTEKTTELSEKAKETLKRIEKWDGPHGMPAEYTDFYTWSELVYHGFIEADSPGLGWGLYLTIKN